jgi:hypothetical protein
MWIEAAVEADHQRGAFGVDDLEAGLDPLDVEIDRLFAEDRLAGPGEALDQIGVGIGGRADDDGVDIGGGFDGLDGAHFGAILAGQVSGGLGHGIGNGDEPGLGIGGHGLGVNLADTACAEKAKTDDHCGKLHRMGRDDPAENMME